jgi:hypothetical protein
MTIDTAEDDVLGFVHRLDALMALQTTDAFRVGLELGLIDPIAWRQSCVRDCRAFDRDGSGRAVAALGSTKHQTPNPKETPSSNYQTPMSRREPPWDLELGISLVLGVWCLGFHQYVSVSVTIPLYKKSSTSPGGGL